MSSSRPSRNLDSEQTENEFDNHVNPIPLPPSRSPLNSIPDPSQNPRENQESESDSRGKLGSTRPKKTETWSSNATPKSRVTKASNGGGGNGSRSHKDSRGGNGSLSKVSRGILSVGTEGFTDVPHFELVEDPSFWLDHNVQVLIRIRPISTSERALQGNARCLRQDNSQTLAWLGHPETRFTFDHIACESISQEKLFKVAGLPMVENCMSGYNSCMFAYGQTGSGKTYTMMGEIHELDGMLSEDCGMTPRIFEFLFMRIRAEEHRRSEEKLKYSCKCSFLEIYNEHITDLLEPSSTNLQIREDMRKGVYVDNLTEYEVTTVKDVLQLLLKGATNRKMAATNMNSESSRSHSVFTCIIESRWDIDTMTHFRFGRLNLVDLAGSERQKSSGAEGERLKEAANINKSLSTLGMVINTLVVVAHGKHRHVPYRDSRLTFLLQDSLGGNSKTTIIANISPSTCSANETLSTLKFAQRAKLIQNNAKVNEDASGDVMALQRQIQQLKDQLTFLLKQQSFSGSLSSSVPDLEKSKFGDIVETYDSFSNERVSDQYNTSIPKEKIRCIKATLVGALRREKMAETAMRRLEAEIEHMNRLVHQQEEDAQRTKMIIRFREEKIKRLELLSDGLVFADEYLMEENNALSEEIQLLQEKIDRNPELTRFALENLRLLEHLRTYEDFYEQGEREIMIAEVSELRDQLMETLKGTHVKLKSSLQVPNQEQDNDIQKELGDCRRNLEACLEINEKLTREVDQSRRELNSCTKYSGTAFDPAENSLCADSGVLQETDKDSLADTILARTDYEDEIASYSHLQTLNDQKMSNALALQLSDAQKELMDARSLIEALEHQQLYLMEELDVLQKNCQYVESLNEDSKERQSQLILGNDHGTSEGHQKIVGPGLQNVGLSMEGSGDIITSDFPSKLDRLNRELEEARILNLQYQDDRASQVSRQNEAELVCQQVEVETAQTILHLQEEFTSLQHEFKEKLVFMTEENTRLINYIQIRENEMRIISENWEKAVLELTSFLSEGCRSLEDASDHIESIASSFSEREVGIGKHVERAVKIFVERERTIMQLKKSLEDAQDMCMELRSKVSSLQGATLAISEVQQLENDESTREVIELQTLLRENISKVMELESKLKSVEEKTTEAERHTDIEFLRMKSLSDFPSYARRRFSGDLDSPSSDQDKYKTSETMVEVDSQAVDTVQVQVGVDEKRGSDHFIVSQTARQLQPLEQSLGIAEADCSNTREMLHLSEADARLISDKKFKMNCRFLRKFEEAHATLEEADLMLNALLKANENAKIMTDTWKQKGEELMIERIGLTEEVQQLKSSIVLKEGESESMQDQMLASLVELSELVSLLEESFVQMKRDVEERFKELYSYVASFGQDVFDCFCSSRASLEDVLSEIVEKGFTFFVLFQCYAGSSFKEILSLESGPDLLRHKQRQCYSILNNTKEDRRENLQYELYKSREILGLKNSYQKSRDSAEEEFSLTTDNLMSENLLLKAELARKDDILKGLLFDISLLQESTSNSQDIKDETEQMLTDLTRVQHELAMKTTQLDDILFKHRQLEARLVDTEAALSISNSELVQAKKTLDVFSKKNGNLSALLEELHANKTATEEQVEEQNEVVKGLEKEILRIAFSVEERVVSSIKSIEEDLRRVTNERDYLLEEVASLNDKLEMANTLSDENEAIAIEARQESEASKVYAEQKEEEAKILERSVEELEHTINVLEKKVYEMSEEVQRHHVMRDDLELELQGLRRRMLVVQNVTENMNTENSDVEQKLVIDRLVECEELRKLVMTLEKKRTDQAREIKECREYISELVLHSEAQASQYQQKYKMLEDMVHEIKRDPSLSASAPSTLDKTEKCFIRPRGSSSPFRCITSLVQQMSVEKDQELSVARLQIEELEALASSRQKEVCMLNARLAAADNMTHDVIRDLLGVKLDMTNYANFIDQHQVQKLVEGAQRKTEEYIAKEQEILQLRKQIQDLVEERQSCIEELNEREADILASRLTLEQLKQRDQMLKAQNEILKMDKAKLKRKLSEMDEMLRKQCGPPSFQQPMQEARKRQESCSLKASRDELGNRLTNSEKLLSRVNNELAWYYESDTRDQRETEETSARNKRQASAQEPEDS